MAVDYGGSLLVCATTRNNLLAFSLPGGKLLAAGKVHTAGACIGQVRSQVHVVSWSCLGRHDAWVQRSRSPMLLATLDWSMHYTARKALVYLCLRSAYFAGACHAQRKLHCHRRG